MLLDHFYVRIPEDKFDILREDLQQQFDDETLFYKKISSDTNSWEGLYLRAHDGSYIELVNEASQIKMAHFGLAMSYLGKENDKFNEYSKFQMTQHRPKEYFEGVSVDERGEDWFDYHGFRINDSLTFWTMKYSDQYAIKRQKHFSSKSQILSFTDIKVSVPGEQFERIEELTSWATYNLDSLSFNNSENHKATIAFKLSNGQTQVLEF